MNRSKFLSGYVAPKAQPIYKTVYAGEKYIQKDIGALDVAGRPVKRQVVTIKSWHPSEQPTNVFHPDGNTDPYFSYFKVEENDNVKYWADKFIENWELYEEK
jgi:hypothetical protein